MKVGNDGFCVELVCLNVHEAWMKITIGSVGSKFDSR